MIIIANEICGGCDRLTFHISNFRFEMISNNIKSLQIDNYYCYCFVLAKPNLELRATKVIKLNGFAFNSIE